MIFIIIIGTFIRKFIFLTSVGVVFIQIIIWFTIHGQAGRLSICIGFFLSTILFCYTPYLYKVFFRDNSDDDDSISKMTSDNDESLTKFILYQRTSEKRETRPKTLKIYFAFFIHRLNFAINQQRIKNNTTPVLYGNKIIIIIIRI